MRILVTIPHYFDPTPRDEDDVDARHGSRERDPRPRIEALTACVAAFRQHFGKEQVTIDIACKTAHSANARMAVDRLDLIVHTTRGRHLLAEVPLADDAFRHQPSEVEPRLLGFECHATLRERLGDYDYYCYVEDDLIVRDPWFFKKLAWFNREVGDQAVLQANRFEVARAGVALKAYIDGPLRADLTEKFQDVNDRPRIQSTFLGVDLSIERASNPHSGCFFLNNAQMIAWASRGDFLDRATGFVGPLESAASLGVMRTFRVYKPAERNASFLEIEHFGTGFIRHLRRRNQTEPATIDSAP